MEKFFTIKKDSDFYKAYVQYQKDVKENAAAFKKFSEEHGIEAKEYLPSRECVMIIPTENDLKKFNGMFTAKELGSGLRQFKKNCKITKDWVEIAKTIPRPDKPNYFVYGMRFNGRCSTRCFMIGDVLYGSVDCKPEPKLLDFMEEIKASEFFKAIEDEELSKEAVE